MTTFAIRSNSSGHAFEQHRITGKKGTEMGRMTGLAAILGAAVLMSVVAACGNGVEPTSLSDEVPTPAPGQLSQWYREAQKAVWPIDGVYTSNIDERHNRIVFGVQTSYVAQQAREALAKTSVPEVAVVFEVAQKYKLDDPPVRVDTPIGVSISLELERTVRVGQSVSIDVVLTNKGNSALELGHGIPFHENVMIFTSDGDQVWTKLRGVQVGVGGSTSLQPSETVRLQTLWNQRDQDGFELPAGLYLVRGTVRIADDLGDDGPFFSGMDLATEPYELIIQP